LPAELQESVRVGQLSTGHAKILKGVNDPARQIALGKDIIARGLSVHATEAFVKQVLAEDRARSEGEPAEGEPAEGNGHGAPEKTTHVQAIEDELRQQLSVRVEVRVRGKDKGQIVLAFECNDDFERIVEALRR
jgi:ParB family chromosome partitioning protein